MSLPIIEACKKRKRRPKLFRFHSFADPGCPIDPVGPFRENIRLFLRECTEPEDYCSDGMSIWCTLLLHENKSFVVPLYTIEENVHSSPDPYCDHCRTAGWSNHFVSKRKYHILVPHDKQWNKPLDDGVIDLQTHLLHGLIHSNGLGHLLCINGIEGGSKFLCGREIMDLWDRICQTLRVRSITVADLSRKRSLDLRLLYGVAYGHPWFGRWGYKFFRGSFGVTEANYHKAIGILSSLELDKIMEDFSGQEVGGKIKQIIQHYRDKSESFLITLKDILRFVLTVKSCSSRPIRSVVATNAVSTIRLPFRATVLKKGSLKANSMKLRRFNTVVANSDSRWAPRRLECAAEVIVNALVEHKAESGCGSMTRQDLRDAARDHIGDTGLLDYVLKSMTNVIVGDRIVRRTVNPSSRVLEYTIDDVTNGAKGTETEEVSRPEPLTEHAPSPGTDVYSDVICLYENVLLNYPEPELVPFSAQVILDSKLFIKEWPFRDEEDQLLRLFCHVKHSLFGLEDTSFKKPPGEVVVLPLHATVMDLKHAAGNALKDTYCIMNNVVVKDIENLGEVEDEELLFGAVESGVEIQVNVAGIDLDSRLRYQGGPDKWLVRCECGAQDDDGERMMACDVCEVWQHTRCCGIQDSEAVPPLFVCPRCCPSLEPPTRNDPLFDLEGSSDLLFNSALEYEWSCYANDDITMLL